VLLAALALAGCAKQPPPDRAGGDPPPAEPANVRIGQPIPAQPAVLQAEAPANDKVKPAEGVPVESEASKQEEYDAARLEALDPLNRMGERRYAEALASLEAARSVIDTEQVRLEIEKLKRVQERQAAGEKTVSDIQVVLNEGRVEVAAHLATRALETYGGTEAAVALEKLKRQADALLTAQLDAGRAPPAPFPAPAASAPR